MPAPSSSDEDDRECQRQEQRDKHKYRRFDQPGRKVLVKGMFITTGEVKRINLLNVIGLADSCN